MPTAAAIPSLIVLATASLPFAYLIGFLPAALTAVGALIAAASFGGGWKYVASATSCGLITSLGAATASGEPRAAEMAALGALAGAVCAFLTRASAARVGEAMTASSSTIPPQS